MNLILFPNPNSGFCWINGEGVADISEVVIRNTLEQIIQLIPSQGSSDTMELDLPDLSPGCYWIHVKSAKGQQRTFKMIRVM